jgi:hypothetical protein
LSDQPSLWSRDLVRASIALLEALFAMSNEFLCDASLWNQRADGICRQ